MPTNVYSLDDAPSTLTTDGARLEWLWGKMRANHAEGHIRALDGSGVRRIEIESGKLVWDFKPTDLEDIPGPKLSTSGKIVIVRMGSVNAPIISIRNSQKPEKFITNGRIGDLYFEDMTTNGVVDQCHAIQIYGVNNFEIGNIVSKSGWRGPSLINFPRKGTATTADQFHIANLAIKSVTCHSAPDTYCVLNEAVSQVFNFSKIGHLWASSSKGCFKGLGAGIKIDFVSAASTSGWALDLESNDGTIQGFHIGFVELDAPKFGMRISGVQHLTWEMVRIVYRRYPTQVGMQQANQTWPEQPILFTSSNSNNGGQQVVQNVRGVLHHRVFGSGLTSESELPTKIVSYGGSPNVREIDLKHFVDSAQLAGTLNLARFERDIHPLSGEILIKINENIRRPSPMRRKIYQLPNISSSSVPAAEVGLADIHEFVLVSSDPAPIKAPILPFVGEVGIDGELLVLMITNASGGDVVPKIDSGNGAFRYSTVPSIPNGKSITSDFRFVKGWGKWVQWGDWSAPMT